MMERNDGIEIKFAETYLKQSQSVAIRMRMELRDA
jgi:hypothetical protein